jgi:hypothetical protein
LHFELHKQVFWNSLPDSDAFVPIASASGPVTGWSETSR